MHCKAVYYCNRVIPTQFWSFDEQVFQKKSQVSSPFLGHNSGHDRSLFESSCCQQILRCVWQDSSINNRSTVSPRWRQLRHLEQFAIDERHHTDESSEQIGQKISRLTNWIHRSNSMMF